jgi:hypothetical protein
MRNLDGGSFDPAANRGKIVVLAFGSTQLPTAKLAVPALQKLADRYADRPVSFYWVSVDSEHQGAKNFASDAQIRVFANQYGMHLPILRDPERSAFKEFGIDALPPTSSLIAVERPRSSRSASMQTAARPTTTPSASSIRCSSR